MQCRGSWAKALAPCRDVECDFLAKGRNDAVEVRTHANSRGWCWWGDVFGRLAQEVPRELRQGCFFPVTRYSKAMLSAVEAELGLITGFCEVYFPTLCVGRGLTYAAMPAACFDVFRFAPNVDLAYMETPAKPDTLCHPVKINRD